MNKLLIVILFCSHLGISQTTPVNYSLDQIITLAHRNSLAAKIAKTEKELSYWKYRKYKTRFNPRLTLDGDIPNYTRDYEPNRQDDNSIEYQLQEQIDGDLTLSLKQPLSWTGGTVSVNSNLNQFRDLRANENETLWNNTVLNIKLDQPIFGFNSLKWDKKVEPLVFEESKRTYAEDLESITIETIDLFFDYLEAQVDLQIAEFNLNNNDTIYKIEKGRHDIGSTNKDQLLEVELELLASKQNVSRSRSDMNMSTLELKILTGVSLNHFSLLIPTKIPDFKVSIEDALVHAKTYRADYIGFERRRLAQLRDIADAKADRYSTNLELSYGLNGTSSDLSESYSNAESQQVLNLNIDLPIMSGGRNRANLKTAMIKQELVNYQIMLDEQSFEQEIITKVNDVQMLKNQIIIAAKSDEIAQERYLISQSIYLIGEIDISKLTKAQKQKDSAKRSYLKALRAFWKAYYQLRKLTLYDYVNNVPLYQHE